MSEEKPKGKSLEDILREIKEGGVPTQERGFLRKYIGPITLSGGLLALACAGMLYLGSIMGRGEAVPVTPTPTPAIETIVEEHTPTPTVYVTPIPTKTPRPTPTYTPTSTPTITPTPTSTPTPLPLKGVGESYSAEGVAVTLESYELKSKDPDCHFDTDIIFHMRYNNQTAEDILLRFNFADFQLHDNLGREYKFTGTDKLIISLRPGGGCGGDFFKNVKVSHLVKAGDSATWYLPFGESDSFDKNVEYVILSVQDFSRIPYAGWKVDIPH